MTATHVSHPLHVDGKFLKLGESRFLARGVSYGTFEPDADGSQYPHSDVVASDFERMRQIGINLVRVYTEPRRQLLDAAASAGLKVMVGLPWAQHVAFLDDARLCREIRRDLAQAVRRVADHPAVACLSLGNEIPPNVIRWHGQRKVERFLASLHDTAKSAAPELLLTYVNYPPTEFLDLSFFDLCAFNVYLHRERDLRAYLARLQNIAGARPLLITEAGADSLREGEEGQAALTSMQIKVGFSEGAAGVVAYTWTDEWWRGGEYVRDWAFGVTDVERRPKLALYSMVNAFANAAFAGSERKRWPRVSVLVCAHNAEQTLDECLTSLEQLNYPNVEIIVVNDGSRDATGAIARRHPAIKLIETDNEGLSAARNTAAHAATGEIVAYIDSDARADHEWLSYLVQPFLRSDAAGAGGPNVVPDDDGWIAQCVARSPGGPTHVLLDDRVAEHIPGVNMAFRRDVLLSIGGFDPSYHAAGDDVDLCWRLQARGYRLEFAPSALVWHRHRNSVKAYWRQQVGYGEAESMLIDRHPEKFLDGNARWRGRIYSPLPVIRSMSRLRINAGVWGTAPFPSVYCTHTASVWFPHSSHWHLLSAGSLLGAVALLAMGRIAEAALLILTAVAGIACTAIGCLVLAWRTDVSRLSPIGWLPSRASQLVYRVTIAALHYIQPLARAAGRVRGRLAPPDPARVAAAAMSGTRSVRVVDAGRALALLIRRRAQMDFWSEHWLDRTALLTDLTRRLRTRGVGRRVDVDDGWHGRHDVAIAVGRWGQLQSITLVEEHARGRCLLRVRTFVRITTTGVVTLAAGVLAAAAMAPLSSSLALAFAGTLSVAAVTGMVRQMARVQTGFRAVISAIVAEHEMQPMTRPAASQPATPPSAVGAPDAVART